VNREPRRDNSPYRTRYTPERRECRAVRLVPPATVTSTADSRSVVTGSPAEKARPAGTKRSTLTAEHLARNLRTRAAADG